MAIPQVRREKEKKKGSIAYKRYENEKIFVTSLEMFFVVGTTLVTLFWNLNAAVFGFTACFYLLHNDYLPINNALLYRAVRWYLKRFPMF